MSIPAWGDGRSCSTNGPFQHFRRMWRHMSYVIRWLYTVYCVLYLYTASILQSTLHYTTVVGYYESDGFRSGSRSRSRFLIPSDRSQPISTGQDSLNMRLSFINDCLFLYLRITGVIAVTTMTGCHYCWILVVDLVCEVDMSPSLFCSCSNPGPNLRIRHDITIIIIVFMTSSSSLRVTSPCFAPVWCLMDCWVVSWW